MQEVSLCALYSALCGRFGQRLQEGSGEALIPSVFLQIQEGCLPQELSKEYVLFVQFAS